MFIEDTFRLRENILLSSNNDANEQAHQTFRKKRISIKPLIKLWRFIFKMISKLCLLKTRFDFERIFSYRVTMTQMNKPIKHFEKKEFRSNLWSNYDVLFLKWFQSFSFFKIDFGPFLVAKSKNKLISSFHLSLPHIEASLKTFLFKVFIYIFFFPLVEAKN